MKNNLFDFKFLKLRNIDVRLQSVNNFFGDAIKNKLEEFTDLKEDRIMEVFEKFYFTFYNPNNNNNNDDDEEYYCNFHKEENNYLACEKLKYETRQDKGCDFFLNAGYVDCMEEAIRFLVEKENISPEHPMVTNLKAHLETSKEKVLGAFFPREYDLSWDDIEEESNSIVGFGGFNKV